MDVPRFLRAFAGGTLPRRCTVSNKHKRTVLVRTYGLLKVRKVGGRGCRSCLWMGRRTQDRDSDDVQDGKLRVLQNKCAWNQEKEGACGG